MNMAGRLRQLLADKNYIVTPGASNPLHARIAEKVGFDFVYMTGYGTSLTSFGIPDVGLLTETQMVANATNIARAVNIPVIAAAQLNRGPADRETHRPRMSDLRESGSIEQDADVVSLLHCEDYYHRGEPNYMPSNITELIIAKQRNGPTGIVRLTFLPHCTRFEPAAHESYAP